MRETPKTPWGKGAEYEAQLTEDEVRAIQNARRVPLEVREDVRALKEERIRESAERFYRALQNGPVSDAFEVDERSNLVLDLSKEPETPPLWYMADATGDFYRGSEDRTHTIADMLAAAEYVKTVYPAVEFTHFIEYKDTHKLPKRYGYVARLRR